MLTQKIRAIALAAAMAAAPALATVGAASSALAQTAAGPAVKIENFTFSPAVVQIVAGTTVTWVNEDDIPHTVVASDRGFHSKVMDTDGRFSFTFTKPGEYGYFCSLHPHMVGKVVVKAQ